MVLARGPDQHEGRFRVRMLSAPRDIKLLGAPVVGLERLKGARL